ncbi:hypothetical protein [Actinomadura litoris]|uniref:hypothetical protein n=1 Tax=Actinomadura litoris TaxID=2678616 RepID=UPI001FA70649|nr:hypothetical protein [Actinomadura litoris]
MSYPTYLTPVERDVRAEREAQDRKWGEQNHPDGTGPARVWVFTGPAEFVAQTARGECERLFEQDAGTWRDVLLEEVAEVFAEDDPVALRDELIQVAAVAQAWIEAIDRRGGREEATS